MDATNKTVQDLAKRYLLLKDRKSKIESEMKDIKKALIAIMDGENVYVLEGKGWRVTYSTYFTRRVSKSAVERIIGASNMDKVMDCVSTSNFTVNRIKTDKNTK